jgi:hypothetical protein
MALKSTQLPKYTIFQMAIYIIYQPFPFQGPPKFTQIGIFGSIMYHLATLPLRQIFYYKTVDDFGRVASFYASSGVDCVTTALIFLSATTNGTY